MSTTQLIDPAAEPLVDVDEFWFAPASGGRRGSAHAGPSLSGLSARGRRAPRRLFAAIASGTVVVLLAAFFVTHMGGSADGQVFRYALTQGTKRTYDLTVAMSGVSAGIPNTPPIQGTVSATMGYEVASTQPDGTSEVVFTMENLRSDPPGAFAPGTGGGSLRVTIAPNGSVTKVDGVGGIFGAASPSSFSSLHGPTDTAGSQFMFPQYPTDKIAPGDGWEERSTVPMPFGDATITVTSTGKHNGFEDTPTYGRVGRFHHAISAPLDMAFSLGDMLREVGQAIGAQASNVPPQAANAVMKITGEMSMDADSLVVPDTSELVRLDGTAKVSMRMVLEGVPPGAGGPPGDLAFDMTMKITMLRVDGSANPAPAAGAGTTGAGATGAGATGADPIPRSERPPGYGDDPPVGSDAAAQIAG